ncbi:zinc-ribbon domain-containing protein [Paenibacillus sp. FSL R5-0701]|uniref:zinc-ribbon domain-containing protein n=1 Tax=Paenibacillus sp. FSL R5-0701 TaxID=2921654 RepID=UPI0030D435AB
MFFWNNGGEEKGDKMVAKGSIQEMKDLAIKREGLCLSIEYTNSNTKLKWRCNCGYVWEATPNNIKRGKWCPSCAHTKNANSKRKTIQDMQVMAERNHGRCISSEYSNMNSKLVWECSKGHQWEAYPSNIYSGKWCPTCAGRNKSLTDMQAFAEEHNGKCLSTQFFNMTRKLKWQCHEGHIWDATPNSILNQKSWCPVCAGNNKKSIKDMEQLAGRRGGKCLSKKYINIDYPLLWECTNGHDFIATPYSIEKGSWCPKCNNNSVFFNEEKCRFILESLTQKKFYKTRKEFGNGYELDGYNEELRLAFEYHGRQHFSYTPYFHNQSEEIFFEQQLRDLKKEQLCKENSIHLIVIPYNVESDTDKVGFLHKKLWELGYDVLDNDLDWRSFYKGFNPLEELHTLAGLKNGICLSNEYNGSDEKLSWECSEGHVWEATPYYIRKGSWCPQCLGRGRTIEDMKILAQEKGGECLSDSYTNNSTKLTWKCESGHVWDATPLSISNGAWCPRCSGRLITIKDMHLLAESKNGKCLSTQYSNNTTPLLWECHMGHQWKAATRSIQQGSWCPSCNSKTINNMKQIAAKYGGECLSEIYSGIDRKLLWKCDHGHQWESSPNYVQRGRWCPQCKKDQKQRKTINKLKLLKELAQQREGRCLSRIYYNVDTKLRWECKVGHQWESTPYSVKNGSWCPTCASKHSGMYRKNNIRDMKRLAEKNDGICISDTYVNSQTKLRWKCKEGHEWFANPNNIQQGSWCPTCRRNEISIKQRKSIEDMIELARKRNGKCLSTEYINAHTKLMWKCVHGHEWEAKPNNIQQGKWCPRCVDLYPISCEDDYLNIKGEDYD